MLSTREHTILLDVMNKRNPRVRKKYNPDFPMSCILRHEECVGKGGYEKFTGVNFNRGKRANGHQRPIKPVYDCRDCRRRIPRDKAHAHITEHLHRMKLKVSDRLFRQALLRVWREQKGAVNNRVALMERNRQELEHKLKSATEVFLEASNEVKASLETLIGDYTKKLAALKREIEASSDAELESDEFVKFALDFMANLATNWWELSPENLKRGVEILFHGKIYANNSAFVCTPDTCLFYRLEPNKKDLGKVSLANMVELAGTAPASVRV